MKNYSDVVMASGVGKTPQLCQDALVEMLEELFEGKKYIGQEGRKPLKVYKQDLPIPEELDEDADTNAAAAPYVMVEMVGGKIGKEDEVQLIEFSLIICCYDIGRFREGAQDVANIKETIIQRVCEAPYFGGTFTILRPIEWAMQRDDTAPYYFGAISLNCSSPVMTQAEPLKEFL